MSERPRKWTREQLEDAARTSGSIRQILHKIGLIPAGGNYVQVQHYIKKYAIDISHFHGKGWRRGANTPMVPARPLINILKRNVSCNTHGLKLRLWASKLKPEHCELCGWNERSVDGRLPLELDHRNGIRLDNRLSNLRILCPNCHSLQLTHRGRNKKHA